MTARNIDKRTDNIVIGAGEVYLDLHEDGAPTGERYLGDAVGAALEITTEETTVFSGSGPVARELARIARSVTRAVTLTLPGLVDIDAAIDGRPVPRAAWAGTRLREGQIVTLRAVAAGGDGKNPLRIILQLALLAAVLYFPPLLASNQIVQGLIGAAIAIVGGLIINAIAPLETPGEAAQPDPVYSLTGGANRARPYRPQLLVLGAHRVFPDLGAAGYTEIVGDDQFLHQIFHFGLGALDVDELRIAGIGLAPERIDDEALIAWGAWCEAQGLRCDYVIDRPISHQDVLTLIARCGRAAVTWQTGKLGAIWEEAGRPATALVTPGNIVAGSFRVEYANGQAADEIAVRYVEPDLDWQFNTLRRFVPGAGGANLSTATVTLQGVTGRDQAAIACNLQAARQLYHRRRLVWDMAAEGLSLARGDVVTITHSLIDGGAAGRLTGGTPDAVTLNRPVDLGAPGGKTPLPRACRRDTLPRAWRRDTLPRACRRDAPAPPAGRHGAPDRRRSAARLGGRGRDAGARGPAARSARRRRRQPARHAMAALRRRLAAGARAHHRRATARRSQRALRRDRRGGGLPHARHRRSERAFPGARLTPAKRARRDLRAPPLASRPGLRGRAGGAAHRRRRLARRHRARRPELRRARGRGPAHRRRHGRALAGAAGYRPGGRDRAGLGGRARRPALARHLESGGGAPAAGAHRPRRARARGRHPRL